jgi:MSHA biogenesis protein MshL
MPKFISKAGAMAVLVLAFAGCQSAPKQSTYEQIKSEVDKAAHQPVPTAPVDAAVSDALLPAASALAKELPKARPPADERFDLVLNNQPAQRFFHALVAGTRFNMLVHPDVSGNVSINLKDVTIKEALDAVRELYGYDYKIEGNRITVRPPSMQTRIFQVNYLLGTRKGSSNLRVTSTSVSNVNNYQNGQYGNQGPYQNGGQGSNVPDPNNPNNPNGQSSQQGSSANVSVSSTSDFWKELKEALEAIVPSKEGGRSIVISPQSGVVIVRAMPEELRNVDTYLKATQLSVDRQVILEAKILEVELNDSFQSGINWASFASFNSAHSNRVATGFVGPGTTLRPLPEAGGQPPTMTTSNGLSASTGFTLSSAAEAAGSLVGFALQTSNFAALISFLEAQGSVHVMQSPRMTAMNNEKSVLKIGTDEFYVTGVSTTTNSSASGNTTSPNVILTPFFSGVVLDVTPQIDAQGNVLLHVHPSISQVSTINKNINLGSAGTLNLPLAASNTSEMDTMVRGQSGEVIAIGGLMRQSSTDDSSQVPVAGSIPVVGNLFKSKAKVNQKRELVVLIKPSIVESGSTWNQDLIESSRRIEKLDPNGRGRN